MKYLHGADAGSFAGHRALAVARITTAGANFFGRFFPGASDFGDTDRFTFDGVEMFFDGFFFDLEFALGATIGATSGAIIGCCNRGGFCSRCHPGRCQRDTPSDDDHPKGYAFDLKHGNYR